MKYEFKPSYITIYHSFNCFKYYSLVSLLYAKYPLRTTLYSRAPHTLIRVARTDSWSEDCCVTS